MIAATEHGIGVPAASGSRNPCKLCTPLGACLVFRGIEGCVPLLHGSQGCATYIRRYLISHFREPVDIASSNFSEETAVFGGASNLARALDNVRAQYQPAMIGIATTCLAETIGEDLGLLLNEYRRRPPAAGDPAAAAPPVLVPVATPSYRGTHSEGFHDAVRAVAAHLAEGGPVLPQVNLLPGLVSPADLRHLKDVVAAFGLDPVLLPDYSDTLDGQAWADYQRIPVGGAPLAALRRMGRSVATLQFGAVLAGAPATADDLAARFGVPAHKLGLPIGVAATDAWYAILARLAGRPTPAACAATRGRLLDAYADGHKYVFGRRAVVFGEEDQVVALAAWLAEIGVRPVVCASGGASGRMTAALATALGPAAAETRPLVGADFEELAEQLRADPPDVAIGHSKGYRLSRALNIPLLRVGFPIHDRFGGARGRLLGYAGAQELFDRLVNALLEREQDRSPVGYSYL